MAKYPPAGLGPTLVRQSPFFTSRRWLPFSIPWTTSAGTALWSSHWAPRAPGGVPWPRSPVEFMWGGWDDASTGLSLSAEDLATIYAQVSAAEDPRVQVAKLQQQIASLTALKRQYPALASLINMRIASAQAQLNAQQERLALVQEGETATRQWRALGMAGGTVAVLGGIGLLALIVTVTRRVGKK